MSDEYEELDPEEAVRVGVKLAAKKEELIKEGLQHVLGRIPEIRDLKDRLRMYHIEDINMDVYCVDGQPFLVFHDYRISHTEDKLKVEFNYAYIR
jgi:hypothetical protein